MKSWFYFFVFSVALSSCRSVKLQPLRTHTTTTVKDSTATKMIKRDTVLSFPKDSVSLSAKFLELTAKPLVKKSKSGEVSVSVRRIGDKVEVTANTELLERIISLQDMLIEHYQDTLTLTKEERVVTEEEMPGWAKIPVGVGLFVILAAFAGLFIHIRSMPRRILEKTLKND